MSALLILAKITHLSLSLLTQVLTALIVYGSGRPRLACVQLIWFFGLSLFFYERMNALEAILMWVFSVGGQILVGHGVLEKKKPSFMKRPSILSIFLSAALAWDCAHWFPVLCRGLVYMHFIKSPQLVKEGPRRVFYSLHGRDIQTQTDDGAIIRGFHILPAGAVSLVHAKHQKSDQLLLEEARLCVLFFHGNCGTRFGVFKRRRPSGRVELCRALASHWDAHVIAFDYRGFADSHDLPPSEKGLALDAQAALRWLRQNAPHARIVLYGQSLGTAVATDLAVNARPCVNGLILDAPFTSIPEAADSYPFVGTFVMPLLRYFGYLEKAIAALPDCRHQSHIHKLPPAVPLLIVHKDKDEVVPSSLGRKVFDQANQAQARSASYNSFLLLKDDQNTQPTMRRHHVDAFTAPAWLVAVDHLFRLALGFDDDDTMDDSAPSTLTAVMNAFTSGTSI